MQAFVDALFFDSMCFSSADIWYAICLLLLIADGSRVSIAIISICDSVCLSVCLCVYVCVCVCPHHKTKTAETKIAKLGTGIVNHDTSPTNEYYRSKVQRSSQGQRVQKVAMRQPCGAVSLRCDAAQRNGAARPA